MEKLQKNFNNHDIYRLISVNSRYWNLGTILITFYLLLTAISIKSAIGADSIVSENQQSQSIESPDVTETPIKSQLHSQRSRSLRERLIAYKQSHKHSENQPIVDTNFTNNIEPETFSNSFSEDNILVASPEKLNTKTENNNNSVQQLSTNPIMISNGEINLQEETNISQQQQPQIIGQIDSSETVGDTFGDTNKLRQELLIEPIVTISEPPKASPGSTAGTPSGYGASFGQAYIGGGLFFPLDDTRDSVDGSLSVGFGLGDAGKAVGLEVNVNITSVGGNGNDFDFGDSGSVGFKLHKYFTDGTAVAIGWSNAVKWGDVNRAKDTIYGVVTKSFLLQPNSPDNKLPLTISVGLGSGSFRSVGAINAGDNSANLFASLGLRVLPQVSLVSSWTGNRLNMGASFAPFKKTPIVINAIFTDVTDNLSNGLGFALSAGYSFRF